MAVRTIELTDAAAVPKASGVVVASEAPGSAGATGAPEAAGLPRGAYPEASEEGSPEVDAPVAPPLTFEALSDETADFLAMVSRLRAALGDTRGKIRVVDVQALAGLDRPSYYRMSLIARAMRHLGWKRSRYRFNGTIAYAYARGTRLQREAILEIECKEGRIVLRGNL